MVRFQYRNYGRTIGTFHLGASTALWIILCVATAWQSYLAIILVLPVAVENIETAAGPDPKKEPGAEPGKAIWLPRHRRDVDRFG